MIIILSNGPYLQFMNCECFRLPHNSLGFLVLNCLFFHCPIFYGLHQRKPLSLLPKKKSCIYTDRVTGREIGVEKKQCSMVHTRLHIITPWYTCGEKTVLNGTHEPPHQYTMVHICTCGALNWSDFTENLPWPSLQIITCAYKLGAVHK